MLALYPKSEERSVLLPPDMEADLKGYLSAQAQIKALKAQQDYYASNLKAALGSAKYGELYNYRVTWSKYETKRMDTKALLTENPDMDRYQVTTKASRLTVRNEE